jgi:phosphoglycerol transferase
MKRSDRAATVVIAPPPPAAAPIPKAWPACLAAGLCAVVVIWALLGLNSENIRIPFSYAGDALAMFSLSKNIGDGNWWWDFTRLGMPFGSDWRDFPMYLTVDFSVIKILGWIFHDPFLSINLCWLLTIVATTVFATFAFIQMRVDRVVSVFLGLVYAMQPYTWLRNVGHFNLMFYLVPLLCGFIVTTAFDTLTTREEDPRPWYRRIPIWVVVAAAAQGLSYAYNSFFTCFFLAMAILIVVGVRKSIRPAFPFAAVLAVVVLFFAINISPSYVYWAKEGKNPSLVQKSAQESDIYGMKLRYLVLPILDHPSPLFRRVSATFEGAFPPANESGTARLGLLGATGFIFLLWTCVMGLFQRPDPRNTVLRIMAGLALLAVLLSVVGGFGSIFNTLAVPDVRCYNRTVTYIDFFCVGAIAILLTRLKRRLQERRMPGVLLNAAIGGIALLAILDESAVSGLRLHDVRAVPFYADRDFGQKLEKQFPPQAKIFQLPHTGFPIDSQPNGQTVYANSVPYLHTARLNWSWGAIEGRHFEWGANMASLPADAMIDGLKKAGFSAIWVNAEGYPDSSKVLAPLTQALGSPILVNGYRHHYVFDLRGVAQTSRKRVETTNAAVVRNLYRDFFEVEADAATVERGKGSAAQLAKEYLNSAPFRDSGVYVASCYLALFDRDPDLAGWQHWTTDLRHQRLTKTNIVETFMLAPEYVQHFGAKANGDLLAQVYRQAGVTPGPEMKAAGECLASGKCALPKVLEQTISRPEFQESTLRRLHMKMLYFVLLGKDPGPVDAPGAPTSGDAEVIESIVGSKEYEGRHSTPSR